jgi:hypothetical protein
MNERIKELAEQAGMIIGDAGEFDMAKFMPKEVKFAQLIVKECGVALSPMLRDMVSRGQAFDLIKKHFGVEE